MSGGIAIFDAKKWLCTFHVGIVLDWVSRTPFWVAGLVFESILGSTYTFWTPFWVSVAYFAVALWKFQSEVFAFKSHAILDAKKIGVAGSMLDLFWGLQGSILGFVAFMLDLFCVLGFNLGPILGFRGTIGAPSTPFYLLEKGCFFLDGAFSISRRCTCFNIDYGHAASVLTIDDP